VVTVTPVHNAVAIVATGATTFCQGGRVVLKAPAGNSYSWSNGATTDSIVVTASGAYSVRVVGGGLCQSVPSNVISVVVNTVPTTPTISLTGARAICEGDSITLTSSAASGNIWSNGATTQSITVKAAGSYSVSVSNGACQSSASANTVVTVNTRPTVGSITRVGDTLSVVGVPNITYSWYFNNSPLSVVNTTSVIATQSGVYKVVATNAAGCTDTASISVITGLRNSIAKAQVRIYPNPAYEYVKVDLTDDATHVYRVVSQLGQVVGTGTLHKSASEVSVIKLPQGIYWLEIEGYKPQQFVKQ
jgi:hypothetical protein